MNGTFTAWNVQGHRGQFFQKNRSFWKSFDWTDQTYSSIYFPCRFRVQSVLDSLWKVSHKLTGHEGGADTRYSLFIGQKSVKKLLKRLRNSSYAFSSYIITYHKSYYYFPPQRKHCLWDWNCSYTIYNTILQHWRIDSAILNLNPNYFTAIWETRDQSKPWRIRGFLSRVSQKDTLGMRLSFRDWRVHTLSPVRWGTPVAWQCRRHWKLPGRTFGLEL